MTYLLIAEVFPIDRLKEIRINTFGCAVTGDLTNGQSQNSGDIYDSL